MAMSLAQAQQLVAQTQRAPVGPTIPGNSDGQPQRVEPDGKIYTFNPDHSQYEDEQGNADPYATTAVTQGWSGPREIPPGSGQWFWVNSDTNTLAPADVPGAAPKQPTNPDTPFPQWTSVGYDSWDPRAQTPGNVNAGVDVGLLPASISAAMTLGIDPGYYQRVMALKDQGVLTTTEAHNILFSQAGAGGIGGSGGANNALGWAQLQNTAANDAAQRLQAQQNMWLNWGQGNVNAYENQQKAGMSLLDYNRLLAEDQAKQAADPFQYGAYLQHLQSLPQGSGNPLQSLIGSGFTIQPTTPDVYNDPRYKALLQSQYNYATPANSLTDIQRMNQAYLEDPARAAAFFAALSPGPSTAAPPGQAAGGQMLTGPVTAFYTDGRPAFTAGENGPEKINFQPQPGVSRRLAPGQTNAIAAMTMHSLMGHAAGDPATADSPYVNPGTVPDQYNGPNDPTSQLQWLASKGLDTPDKAWAYAAQNGGPARTGGNLSPANASAISLGKALRPLGFAPPEMLAYLDRGEAPPPGTVTDQFLQRLPPSLKLLLQGTVQQFGNNVADYNAAQAQFNTPGYKPGSVTYQ
jgi:hypothetical protein